MSSFGRDLDVLIGKRWVINTRHNSRRQVFRALDAMESGVRLQRYALDLRVELLQSTRRPNECSSGSKHGDEVSDASLGLEPDFICGRFVMRTPVGFVRILIRIKVKIGMALSILPRDLDGAIRTFSWICKDDICAICL